MLLTAHRISPSHARMGLLAAATAASAATALWVEAKSRRAEREHQPPGRLMYVDGVRLHYLRRGEGPPVVLLHGNTLSSADFEACGLIDRLARQHTVIAFDRPGFGHSDRPRNMLWTPKCQGALLHRALAGLGIQRPTLVGHSLGTQVAVAMALENPGNVAGLVLVGGYFHPSFRPDAWMLAPVALPVIGDVLRYTGTAFTARATLNATVRAMFAPQEVPPDFYEAHSRELLLRPLQLRANAEDGRFMVPQARALAKRYGELRMPVTLIAGAQDKVVDPVAHTERLHLRLLHSQMHIVPGAGHMAHYVAQDTIAEAVG